MKRPRKVAVYKARTGGKLRRAGIYFDSEFENKTVLEPAKSSIKVYSTREGECGREIRSHREFIMGGYYIDKAVECIVEDEKV